MADSKRDLIMAAGARVFPELGFHKATVEDVIKAAGVARSTFYAYFSSKRELFIYVVTARTNDIVEIVRIGVNSIIAQFELPAVHPMTSLFEEPLALLSTEVFAFVRRNRGVAKVFLHEMVGADEEFSRIYNDFQEQLVDQFQRLIECGIKTGVMRKIDPRTAAEFIVSGHMYLARSFSAGRPSLNIETVAHQFSDLQFRGLIHRSAAMSADENKAMAAAEAPR